jgi:hypothetical protein
LAVAFGDGWDLPFLMHGVILTFAVSRETEAAEAQHNRGFGGFLLYSELL